MSGDEIPWRKTLGLEEPVVFAAAKRCGMTWAPWMGDWFVAYSPRNGNTHSEGTWEHWVTLAQLILTDPLTEIVRPDVYLSVPPPPRRYDESDRRLTDGELEKRFRPEVDSDHQYHTEQGDMS